MIFVLFYSILNLVKEGYLMVSISIYGISIPISSSFFFHISFRITVRAYAIIIIGELKFNIDDTFEEIFWNFIKILSTLDRIIIKFSS